MADAKVSALNALTGANVDLANDVLPIVDTSVTTTKKILAQELFNSMQSLASLTGAGTDTAADSIPIFDNSAATEKKILVSELQIAMGIAVATQAQQEAGTSTAVFTSPGRQHFHASACKAWGLATMPSTITTGYPAAGASVADNTVGVYTVTHGVTFSSASYAVNVTAFLSATISIPRITIRDATTFTVKFTDETGAASVPTSFSYTCFGDL